MNVAEELKKAKAEGYAIGAFNTSNLEVTKAICAAAKELDAPILIQTTPSAIEYAGLKTIFDIVQDEIENSGIKAAIHLDHGKDWETAKACLDMGYKSVMIDGSKLPYEENVKLTKKVVEYAHNLGAAVEAEIGVLGAREIGEVGQDTKDVLSSPERTAKFVKETGIDSIAIAIGNEHGAPKGEKIDLELLQKISQLIEIPLVMHGSSGLADSDIKEALSCGVAKFNVDTLIRRAFVKDLADIPEDEKDYRVPLQESMKDVEEIVKERIRLFRNK